MHVSGYQALTQYEKIPAAEKTNRLLLCYKYTTIYSDVSTLQCSQHNYACNGQSISHMAALALIETSHRCTLIFKHPDNMWQQLWQHQTLGTKPTHNTTRHRASTSMYSLTFRVRVTTPAVWTKWNGACSRQVDFIAGEGSLRRHA